MILGSVLSLCNIYSGLKIGWGFNMSITACLLSYGFFQVAHALWGSRPWNILENNINQTAASSAAMISSAGLVAPIPAWTIITGDTLPPFYLILWVFSVAVVGVVVAIGVRKQMLLVDRLPFPGGIATAETLKQMYARGSEALARVKMLLTGALFASLFKIFVKFASIPKWPFPGGLSTSSSLSAKGVPFFGFKQIGFALDPSVLMVAVGGIIGLRACLSIFFGGLLAWIVIAYPAMEAGWITIPVVPVDPWGVVLIPNAKGSWYPHVQEWLLWPGVTMMVTAALTSFSFSWRSVLATFSSKKPSSPDDTAIPTAHEVPRRAFFLALLLAGALAVYCQISLFSIRPSLAVLSVLLTFVLAIVAGRVTGETGVTPVGPMGKITQLTFGVLDSGNATANLMAANVTGGAASQCSDLLTDMKTGLLIGASPRYQAIAQFFGVFAGSIAGSLAYIILIPDPKTMLLTEEWAAPAVAQWKVVAELFKDGLSNLPPSCQAAALWAGIAGILLAITEKIAPPSLRSWIPSPAGIGLAFVLPGYYAVSFFLGGVAAAIVTRLQPEWAERFLLVLCAGMIAGESLTGMILAFL